MATTVGRALPRRGGAGERILSSPQRERRPKPESPQAILARKSDALRHLGASSPSGNARGGCRGCIPFRTGRKVIECKRYNVSDSNSANTSGVPSVFRPRPTALHADLFARGNSFVFGMVRRPGRAWSENRGVYNSGLAKWSGGGKMSTVYSHLGQGLKL